MSQIENKILKTTKLDKIPKSDENFAQNILNKSDNFAKSVSGFFVYLPQDVLTLVNYLVKMPVKLFKRLLRFLFEKQSIRNINVKLEKMRDDFFVVANVAIN